MTYSPHPRQRRFLESEHIWRLRGGSTVHFIGVDGPRFVGLDFAATVIDAPDPRAGWRRRRRERRARRHALLAIPRRYARNRRAHDFARDFTATRQRMLERFDAMGRRFEEGGIAALLSDEYGRSLFRDRDGNPVSVEEWCALNEAAHAVGREYCIVARDELEDGSLLSTVLIPIETDPMRGPSAVPPFLFESMLFGPDGNSRDQRRYRTEAEAIAGHAELLRTLRPG